MLHCEMERPTYQQHVPSVARAVQALERLAAAGQPLSLSTLSRALEIWKVRGVPENPSAWRLKPCARTSSAPD